MKHLSSYLLLFLLNYFASGQIVQYEWTNGLCYFSGEYDSTKISKEELNDTYSLCCADSAVNYLEVPGLAWRPSQIDSLNLTSLDKEYDIKSKRLKEMKLIKTPFWEEQRQYKIESLKEMYRFKQIAIQAYKNPSILKEYPLGDSCFEYADAIIAGGDSMLNEWKRMRLKHCETNGDPKWCYDEYYLKRYNSSERLIWAKLDLMMFGWWNCTCRFLKFNEPNGKAEEEFEKLFQNVKENCDD